MNFTGGPDLLQQHAEDVLMLQCFVSVVDNHVKTEGFRAGTDDVQSLRMHVGRHEEAVGVLQFAHALGHRHRFSGCGGFVQQRGGGHIETGQIQRHLLEVEQRFQTTLRNFWLIRGVRGVPARVFQHVALDNRRQLYRGVTHANV